MQLVCSEHGDREVVVCRNPSTGLYYIACMVDECDATEHGVHLDDALPIIDALDTTKAGE